MLELVDKKKVSCMRIGRVLESIGGRLQLKYEFNGGEFEDFWCHQASPLIHPTGWSVTVGHEIVASESSSEFKKKIFFLKTNTAFLIKYNLMGLKKIFCVDFNLNFENKSNHHRLMYHI